MSRHRIIHTQQLTYHTTYYCLSQNKKVAINGYHTQEIFNTAKKALRFHMLLHVTHIATY